MFIISSFLLILSVVAKDNPSQEYLNNNNELTNDEEEPYCGKINMDADDITFTKVEGKEDTIALNWTEAFKKDNVDKFTIADCLEEVVINYGCESIETCCFGRASTKSSETIFPADNTDDTLQITVCGDQRYVCISYKGYNESKWIHGGKRLERLPSCAEFCESKTWLEYTDMFKNYKIVEFLENGQYIVDWRTHLGDYGDCLNETSLYYAGTHLRDVPPRLKCSEGFKNFTIVMPIRGFPVIESKTATICGDAADACLEFIKGHHKYTRPIKLTNIFITFRNLCKGS